jgi:hypothetical protein
MLHSTPGALNRIAAANRLTLMVFPNLTNATCGFRQEKRTVRTSIIEGLTA